MPKTATFMICVLLCGLSQIAFTQEALPYAGFDPAPQFGGYRSKHFGATLELCVADRAEVEHSIYWEITNCGGYEQSVASGDVTESNSTLTITAEVPVDKVDNLLTKIQLMGTTITKTVSPHEPSALSVINGRLNSLYERQTLLNESNSAGKNKVELATLQQQIDEIKTERGNYVGAIDNTTLQLTVRQNIPSSKLEPGWLNTTIDSATSIAESILAVVVKALVWIAIMSPFYMPFLAGMWLWVRHLRRPNVS